MLNTGNNGAQFIIDWEAPFFFFFFWWAIPQEPLDAEENREYVQWFLNAFITSIGQSSSQDPA